ncbi:MAG: hypothetical protein JWN63_2840 [Candidatus Acidoferrum typicum]|nr:hypothetical protein [Candidatus Acidoferrum typicum]
MAHSMSRSLYRWLLYLHPPAFRQRFAEEMLWIFDEAAATHGVLRLFADGFVSLLRQWVVRPESWNLPVALAVPQASAGPSTFLAWEHFEVPQYSLPLYRWIQGGVVTLGLLSAVWLMAGPGRRVPILPRDFAGARGSRTAWALPTQNAPSSADDFFTGTSGEGGYAMSGTTEDTHQHQLRQQKRALQNAIAEQSVPGSFYYVVEPRGTAVETPKTPAGEQFSAWLSAFNRGDRAQLEGFLAHYKNPGEHDVNGDLGFRQQTGGFDLKKIEETAPTRISGLVQERDSDQFARFMVEVEAEAPHQILHLDLRAIPRPAEFPVERMSQSELLAALRVKLEKDSAEDKFAGAVILAKDGKTIFSGAYGMADREKKTPNTLDTKFRIGSMNKMITATSIMQLVHAGKMSLTDPFGKYITDYPNKDFASKATIQQLLTHTGNGRHFRARVRGAPKRAAHASGLREFIREAQPGI